MSYSVMYGAAVIVAVLLAVIGAIQAADPVRLGIPAVVIEWLKVIVPGLGILAGILPSIRTPPNPAREGLD